MISRRKIKVEYENCANCEKQIRKGLTYMISNGHPEFVEAVDLNSMCMVPPDENVWFFCSSDCMVGFVDGRKF